ncbi:MAG: efflux RND transporter periplasmic adaptor subunit [Bacteroidia bacterium]|nr:efflux RND transporter periplasmic adaptor subunit [Bacteroidia bacterium]
MKYLLYILLFIFLIFMGCGESKKGAPEVSSEKSDSISAEENSLTLGQSKLMAADIQFEQAEKSMFPFRIRGNGKVTILANAQADIASPFRGTVKRFFAKEGQYITKGQAILELSVPDLIQYQEQYLLLQGELSFLRQEESRQKALQSENVGALKNLQEVQSKILIAESRLQSAAAMLRIAEIPSETLVYGTPFISTFTLKSPISGFVSHFPVTLGAPATEGTVLAHINNLDDLHADVFIYEKDIQKVKIGQSVQLTFADSGIPPVNGKIEYIGKELDAQHKTAMLHIPFSAPKGIIILPEMQVTAHIETGIQELYTLPESALIHGEEGEYLFYTENPKSEKVTISKYPLHNYSQQNGKIGFQTLPSEGVYFPVKGANIVNGEYKRDEMEEE